MKYRSIDGSCNNILNPTWGQTLTAQRRFVPAAFDDGKMRLIISNTAIV